MASTNQTVVIPANAGIQYAAAYRSITAVSGILDHPLSRMMTVIGAELPPHPEKFPHQRCRFALADGGIDFRHVMTGGRRKEPHAGIHSPDLGIGGAAREPPLPCKRDRAGAHRA